MMPWPENSTAVERFVLPEGEILSHADAWAMVGLEYPDPSVPWQAAQEAQLQFVQRWDIFRQALLAERQIDLQSVRGKGYAVVPPDEQVAQAAKDTRRALQSKLTRGIARIEHVDLARLSDEEKAARVDAMGRLEQLKSAVRKKRDRLW